MMMFEDLDMRCENCNYCEYTLTGKVCRWNGEKCPTDGTCYKTEQVKEQE